MSQMRMARVTVLALAALVLSARMALGQDMPVEQVIQVPSASFKREFPATVILPAGYSGTQVEEAVLRHPGIARAVRQGDLEVAKRADEAPRRSPRRNPAEGVGENQ